LLDISIIIQYYTVQYTEYSDWILNCNCMTVTASDVLVKPSVKWNANFLFHDPIVLILIRIAIP
jgi:hypothetical protein